MDTRVSNAARRALHGIWPRLRAADLLPGTSMIQHNGGQPITRTSPTFRHGHPRPFQPPTRQGDLKQCPFLYLWMTGLLVIFRLKTWTEGTQVTIFKEEDQDLHPRHHLLFRAEDVRPGEAFLRLHSVNLLELLGRLLTGLGCSHLTVDWIDHHRCHITMITIGLLGTATIQSPNVTHHPQPTPLFVMVAVIQGPQKKHVWDRRRLRTYAQKQEHQRCLTRSHLNFPQLRRSADQRPNWRNAHQSPRWRKA